MTNPPNDGSKDEILTQRSAGLAALALFSLSFVTQRTLSEEREAQEFFRNWIKNTKLSLDVQESDIPELVRLARKGEHWLEQATKAYATSNT